MCHRKYLLDRLVPIAGEHISGPKLTRLCHPLSLMPQHNNLFCTQATRRQRGAQAHCPITNDRHAGALLDVRAYCRVMACRYGIGQGQKRLEQALIPLNL
jgi:hypothetical protein